MCLFSVQPLTELSTHQTLVPIVFSSVSTLHLPVVYVMTGDSFTWYVRNCFFITVNQICNSLVLSSCSFLGLAVMFSLVGTVKHDLAVIFEIKPIVCFAHLSSDLFIWCWSAEGPLLHQGVPLCKNWTIVVVDLWYNGFSWWSLHCTPFSFSLYSSSTQNQFVNWHLTNLTAMY